MDGPRQSFLKFKDVLCKRISDILRSEGASSLWQCVARTYQIQSLFQPVLKKKKKSPGEMTQKIFSPHAGLENQRPRQCPPTWSRRNLNIRL